MTGRAAIHCPTCNHVVAYISESAAKRAMQGTAMGLLPFAVVAARAAEAAALRCCQCEGAAIAAAAVAGNHSQK